MSFGIPSSADNRALAGVINRRIKSDASRVAATAAFWRLLGFGGFCLLLGAGVGAALFGYSYITDGQASMEKLSTAMAAALSKTVIKVADVKGTVALDANSSVRLDTNVTPEQGATSSSSSIERGGPQVRAAAAEAQIGRAHV